MDQACSAMPLSLRRRTFGLLCQPVSSRAIILSGPSSRASREYLVIRQEQVANQLIGRPPADRADIRYGFDSTQNLDAVPYTHARGSTFRQILVELHQQPARHYFSSKPSSLR